MPRMTTAQRDAIQDPAVGLTIFNLDDGCTDVYGNFEWLKNCPHQKSDFEGWVHRSEFAGPKRLAAVSFSINGKGYVGTGNSQDGVFIVYDDFWEYDPICDTWTRKADFPGGLRHRAIGFSIGGKGYLGTGVSTSGRMNDFWE